MENINGIGIASGHITDTERAMAAWLDGDVAEHPEWWGASARKIGVSLDTLMYARWLLLADGYTEWDGEKGCTIHREWAA
jgi:hypothetical protein